MKATHIFYRCDLPTATHSLPQTIEGAVGKRYTQCSGDPSFFGGSMGFITGSHALYLAVAPRGHGFFIAMDLPAANPSRKKHREATVWQRRFWEHMIRDDRDFSAHCDYIHYNPVKHGLVNAPKAWPHSTFHRFAKKGLYSSDWGATPVAIEPAVGRE